MKRFTETYLPPALTVTNTEILLKEKWVQSSFYSKRVNFYKHSNVATKRPKLAKMDQDGQNRRISDYRMPKLSPI